MLNAFLSLLTSTPKLETLKNGLAKIFYVKIKDSISCINFVFTYGKKVYAILIGTSRQGYELGIPAFTTCSTLQRCKELGFESYNLGGVPDDSSKSGLFFFKTSLGAKRFSCTGGSTNYLCFPHKCFNPLLEMGRKMPESTTKNIIKKFVWPIVYLKTDRSQNSQEQQFAGLFALSNKYRTC